MDAGGFAPLAAEAGYQANLPLQFTRFFGTRAGDRRTHGTAASAGNAGSSP
jgi:hypothetical protein